MKNKKKILLLIFLSQTLILFIPGLRINHLMAQTDEADNILIVIGLTTERSKTQSDDGSFSAEVLCKNGVAAMIYYCQENVEGVVKEWAKNQKVKLIEKKSDSNVLHLVYASRNPSGNFIIDYEVSSNLEKVKITFWFRTLTNIKLSGDQMGLEQLGEKLLTAIQCVPQQ